MKLAAEHNFLIIEDDPYGELRFTEERHPTLHQVSQRVLGNTDHIIYTSTFSKILAPGLRLGWAILPPFLLHKVAIIKQAADLHASALSQSIVECYLGLGRLPAQIDKIRAAYKQKGEIRPVWWSRSWATTSPSISRRAACSCGHVSASRSTPPNG